MTTAWRYGVSVARSAQSPDLLPPGYPRLDREPRALRGVALPVNVLLIQADAHCAGIIRDALARKTLYSLEWVQSCAIATERLRASARRSPEVPFGISVILVDLDVPDGRGFELIELLHSDAPKVPIVILSSAKKEDPAAAALKFGAQDFILKERVDDYVLPKTLAAVIDRVAVADALFHERERAQITLDSIGDAVICTDVSGNVSYLNAVAERLTGWPSTEALGQPFEKVTRVVDSATGATVVNPMSDVDDPGVTHGLSR